MLGVQCAQTGPAQGSSSPFTDALQLVLRPSFYFPLAFHLSSPVCHVLCRKGPTSSSSGIQFFRRCHRHFPPYSFDFDPFHSDLLFALSIILLCPAQNLSKSTVSVFQGSPFTDTQKASVALLLSFSLFQLICNMNLHVF